MALDNVYRAMGVQDVDKASQDDVTVMAAREFLDQCGLVPNADAIEQLIQVFLPCLAIMCERNYDPTGGTWHKSGRLGVLMDLRKKFERTWHFLWLRRETNHDDSLLDLINYAGFVLRAPVEGFGDWGEPGSLVPGEMNGKGRMLCGAGSSRSLRSSSHVFSS